MNHIRIAVICLSMTMLSLPAESQNLAIAQSDTPSFKITTWWSEKGNVRKKYPNARYERIVPLRLPAKDNIECDDVSNNEGVMTCWVTECEKNSPTSRGYDVVFAQQRFVRHSPARINVSHCVVAPQEIDTVFIHESVFAKVKADDINFLFSKDVWSNTEKSDALSREENFINNINIILDGDHGSERGVELRKYIEYEIGLAREFNNFEKVRDMQNLLNLYSSTLASRAAINYWLVDPQFVATGALNPTNDSRRLNRNFYLITNKIINNINKMESDSNSVALFGDIYEISDIYEKSASKDIMMIDNYRSTNLPKGIKVGIELTPEKLYNLNAISYPSEYTLSSDKIELLENLADQKGKTLF